VFLEVAVLVVLAAVFEIVVGLTALSVLRLVGVVVQLLRLRTITPVKSGAIDFFISCIIFQTYIWYLDRLVRSRQL